jgi:hypothetical protein
MWLSHDWSSEYALEMAELGVFYASINNRIIVLKTAKTTRRPRGAVVRASGAKI